jgi:2-amino-4-hydroxy-6-hydroxymethyldihydropteridine diphosphokinase
MNTVFLLLGANLGNMLDTFAQATQQIEANIGFCVKKSSVFVSPPWGFEHSNEFYNQVLVIETAQIPSDVLQQCMHIENNCGRIRKIEATGYEARTLDIDILFYNSDIIATDNLHIPHLQIHNRKFTLAPLLQIAPDFVHPIFSKTIAELHEQCTDSSKVSMLL